MSKVLKYFIILIFTVIITLALIIMHAHITYYRPDKHTELHRSMQPDTLIQGEPMSMMTWNLGYAGLGADMDFFYDGGSQVRTSREQTLKNLENIHAFIKLHSNTDFFLFQEADKGSRRSYFINMPDSIAQVLPDTWMVFAKNYDVRFVPVPWYAPMGKVVSGIVTASQHLPASAKRVSYPGKYPWPGRLFNLKRCLIINRYQVNNGKELVIINTHNSAFDDGNLRILQMEHLRKIFINEYDKGNYVIAGGDFNQCPPGFIPKFEFNVFDDQDVMYIPGDYLPGWHFVFDPETPTNRRVKKPYDPNTTKTTLIDFFIASPNVEPILVKGIHLNFEHSDHNPVLAEFVLLNTKK